MKFLFPPALFGPLSGNIMACFSQISLVFEIGEPTNRLRPAEDGLLRLWQIASSYKQVIFCHSSPARRRLSCAFTLQAAQLRNCSIVTDKKLNLHLCSCLQIQTFQRENGFFNTFQSVSSFWWVNIVSHVTFVKNDNGTEFRVYNPCKQWVQLFSWEVCSHSFPKKKLWMIAIIPTSSSHCPGGVIVQKIRSHQLRGKAEQKSHLSTGDWRLLNRYLLVDLTH